MGEKLARAFVLTWGVVLLGIIALAALCLGGCAPIQPAEVQAGEPSWDGATQNSGLVRDVNTAMTVTTHWRDRYNAMIAIYGAQFAPAMTKDAGITVGKDGTVSANHFARVRFYVMNTWRTSAMHQPPPPQTLIQKAGL